MWIFLLGSSISRKAQQKKLSTKTQQKNLCKPEVLSKSWVLTVYFWLLVRKYTFWPPDLIKYGITKLVLDLPWHRRHSFSSENLLVRSGFWSSEFLNQSFDKLRSNRRLLLSKYLMRPFQYYLFFVTCGIILILKILNKQIILLMTSKWHFDNTT